MSGKRRFHRVRFVTKSVLKHNNCTYPVRLENISLNGALFSLNESAIVLIQPGDKCTLAVYPGEEEAPLQFVAEVIHAGFSVAGVQFFAMDAETETRLCTLIERVTPTVGKLLTGTGLGS